MALVSRTQPMPPRMSLDTLRSRASHDAQSWLQKRLNRTMGMAI